jgi:aspartate carbamoyltransferase catalytic subunit
VRDDGESKATEALTCPLINAGDGPGQHPTQVREREGGIERERESVRETVRHRGRETGSLSIE